MEKPILYLSAKLATAASSIILLSGAKEDLTFRVISFLSFSCVFIAEYLFDRLLKNRTLNTVIIITTIIACFAMGLEAFFPLYIILIIHLLDLTVGDRLFYEILFVIILLSFFMFIPGKNIALISFLSTIFVLGSRYILDKLLIYRRLNDEQKVSILELNKKMNDLKSLTKTLKHTTSIEERNRIAARIHDQIGHGISGSIILLEASLLIMKDNPEKAVSTVQKVITNLRTGVDEIRMSLREERADRYLLGINDITALLDEFKVNYSIETDISTKGDIRMVTDEVWVCIHDNLKECLTNLLKHSNANKFLLNIEVYKKLIKVEYKDNGKSTGDFEKGLGLEAIEERTIRTKGRCFFNKGENGFSITNIFSI